MLPILIVEDEEHLRNLYHDEFSEAGFAVRSISTGREAIDYVRRERPSLVVLDIKLEDMDGLRVLEEIKEIDRTIPVILNSAYAVYKADFASWMADDYVVKSSNIADLLSKVKLFTASSGNKTGINAGSTV